jgi:hypothetical protein
LQPRLKVNKIPNQSVGKRLFSVSAENAASSNIKIKMLVFAGRADLEPVLQDFSLYNIPKRENKPNEHKYTK